MIKGDTIENYLFIRHHLFRITEGIPESVIGKELKKWLKKTFIEDFNADDLKKVRVVLDPKELDDKLRLMYINYLELKVYNGKQLMG